MAKTSPLAPGGSYFIIRAVTPNPRFFGLIKKYLFLKCCGQRMDRRLETTIAKCAHSGHEATIHIAPLAVCRSCGRIKEMQYGQSPFSEVG